MFLSKIKVKNYRLLINAELNIDKNLTLIVGRNNTAKTSIANFIEKVLSSFKTKVSICITYQIYKK